MNEATIALELACDELTEGEKTFLVYATLGYTAQETALYTSYSKRTVESYLQDARDKLHARNCADACYLARFFGFISDAQILGLRSSLCQVCNGKEANATQAKAGAKTGKAAW